MAHRFGSTELEDLRKKWLTDNKQYESAVLTHLTRISGNLIRNSKFLHHTDSISHLEYLEVDLVAYLYHIWAKKVKDDATNKEIFWYLTSRGRYFIIQCIEDLSARKEKDKKEIEISTRMNKDGATYSLSTETDTLAVELYPDNPTKQRLLRLIIEETKGMSKLHHIFFKRNINNIAEQMEMSDAEVTDLLHEVKRELCEIYSPGQ